MSAGGHSGGPDRARVVHKIRGRVRLRISGAKNLPGLLEHIRKALAGMPGVTSVEANPLTGSVVLHYDHPDDESAGRGRFLEWLSDFAEQVDLFTLAESPEYGQVATDLRNESEFLASHSKTATAILDQMGNLNTGFKKVTDNALDLNVALPLGLGALAAATVGLEAGAPLWITLALSAFHSFVSLHTSRQFPVPPGKPGGESKP